MDFTDLCFHTDPGNPTETFPAKHGHSSENHALFPLNISISGNGPVRFINGVALDEVVNVDKGDQNRIQIRQWGQGRTGSSVVVYGHLFVVYELERMKLKVYYPDVDSWETTAGPPLTEQIHKPFYVDACDSIIYVVGRGLHVAFGYISNLNRTGSTEKRWSFAVRWHVIDGPTLSDLTSSSSLVLFA